MGQDRELTTDVPQDMADVIGIDTSPVEKIAGRTGLLMGVRTDGIGLAADMTDCVELEVEKVDTA